MAKTISCIICGQSVDSIKKIELQFQQFEIGYCQRCDFKFCHNVKEAPPEYYERLYTNWNIEGISLRGLVWGHKQALKLIKQYLKKPGVFLLDIGCAEGLFVKEARKKNINASGIDINCQLITIARKLYDCNTVFCCRLEDLEQYLKNKFDIITLIDVLEHLSNPVQYLNQIKKHLKNKGFVFVSLPNKNCYPRFLPPEGDFPPHHLTWWSKKSLFEFFQLNGYEILEYRAEPANPKDMAVWFDYLLSSKIKAFKSIKNRTQKTVLQKQNKKLKKLIYQLKKLELDFLTAIFYLPAKLLTFFGGIGTSQCILAKKE